MPDPGKLRRKPRPADTEKTTVSTLTRAASDIDRSNDTGMFAIWPGLTMFSNQTVEVPTMGKVTPPSGPWNDST